MNHISNHQAVYFKLFQSTFASQFFFSSHPFFFASFSITQLTNFNPNNSQSPCHHFNSLMEMEIHPEKNTISSSQKQSQSFQFYGNSLNFIRRKPPTKHIPETSDRKHHRARRRGDYPLCQSWPIPSPERLGRS